MGVSMNVDAPCQSLLIRNALSTPQRRRNQKKVVFLCQHGWGENEICDEQEEIGGNQEANLALQGRQSTEKDAQQGLNCTRLLQLHH